MLRLLYAILVSLTLVRVAHSKESMPVYVEVSLPLTPEWAESLKEFGHRRDISILDTLKEFGIPVHPNSNLKINEGHLMLTGTLDWQASLILMSVLSSRYQSTKQEILESMNKFYLDRFEGPFALPKESIIDRPKAEQGDGADRNKPTN